jgi:hypothetical protein
MYIWSHLILYEHSVGGAIDCTALRRATCRLARERFGNDFPDTFEETLIDILNGFGKLSKRLIEHKQHD